MQVFGLPGHVIRNGKVAGRLGGQKKNNNKKNRRRALADSHGQWADL
jgi:hypothetical protein